jgi:hypothetical protein
VESLYDDVAGRIGSVLRLISQFLYCQVEELTCDGSFGKAHHRLGSHNALSLLDRVSQGQQVANAKS